MCAAAWFGPLWNEFGHACCRCSKKCVAAAGSLWATLLSGSSVILMIQKFFKWNWYLKMNNQLSLPLRLSCRPEPDAQLSAGRAATPSGSCHPWILRGAGQPAGSPRWAGVWEGGEEHLHHGPDGGAEQAEGAKGQQQTPTPGQGPESAGGGDATCERRKHRLHGTLGEDRDHACQGEDTWRTDGQTCRKLIVLTVPKCVPLSPLVVKMYCTSI